MPAEIDVSAWSGEGAFTQVLIDYLRALPLISFLKVEDAPATRSDADYNFMSNEIFVRFATVERREPYRRFGVLPASRLVVEPAMTFAGLEADLSAAPEPGPPDYGDATMLQYLRSERIVPPYQTRGYKLVELVRIYEVGTPSRT
jgi:hypothetical protein